MQEDTKIIQEMMFQAWQRLKGSDEYINKDGSDLSFVDTIRMWAKDDFYRYHLIAQAYLNWTS